jgi:hypothetical protein
MGAIADQPVFVILMGAIGTGKSTDALMSFPRGRFIAAPGALKPSMGVAGFEPADVRDVDTIPDMIKIVEATKPGQADALVVDDFTLYVKRQVRSLERSGVGGFDLWGAVHRYVLDLREALRRCGMHGILTMHELPPRMDNGIRLPGCPALPGKTLPYDVPAAADIVLRAQPIPSGMAAAIGWPVVYRCDPADPEWRTKDRTNTTPDMAPMNIGEILRLAARENGNPKFAPRRLAALEWHEPWVETAAQAIMSGKGVVDLTQARAVLGQLEEACLGRDPDPRHALWACRDAWDRAFLRSALAKHRRKFFFKG